MSTQELSIPRWKASQLAPGFFKESFYLRNKPVIITDLANDWPAVGKWTPEFLCNTYPDTKATGLTWDGTGVDAFLHYTRLTTNLKEWGDIILRPTGERRAYLTFPVFQAVPELAKDIRPLDSYMGLPSNYPKALRRRAKKPPSLWFGGAGQISPMHFDMSQNFLVQIYGTKKMVLFSPDQSEYVYWPCDQDEPFSYHNVNWTPVDAFNPDFALHPLFKKARGIEITLEPGDILYLPVRWWHFTQSVTDSLSVNFFWQTHWTMLRNADLVWPTFRRMAKARLAAG